MQISREMNLDSLITGKPFSTIDLTYIWILILSLSQNGEKSIISLKFDHYSPLIQLRSQCSNPKVEGPRRMSTGILRSERYRSGRGDNIRLQFREV